MPKNTKYTTRLIAPMQSLGRCGKSTFVQALISYFKYADVDVRSIDADGVHKTLSGWIKNVPHLPFTEAKDLQPILNHCGETAVEIVDFPAQATDQILIGLDKFRAKEIFEIKKVRLTIPLFASDERAAMASAFKIVQATKSYADFILVLNPARYSSDIFLGSEKLIAEIGDSAKMSIIALTEETINQIDAASKKKKKSLTFDEALDELPIASKMEVQTFLNSLYAQFEDAAASILPDVSLIKNKVVRDSNASTANDIDEFSL